MADGIDVPINLPTESASVRAAAGVVKALEANLAALGPAAAAGSAQAQASMRALGAAAQGAQKQLASLRAQDAARAALPRLPGGGPGGDKARAAAEAAAGKAAVKAIDDARKAAADAQRKRDKQAADDAKKSADKTKAGNEALAKSSDELLGKIGAGIAAAMVAVAAIVATITAQFAVALVKVQAFKESTIGAFTKLLGGAKAADDAFKATIKTADEIGISYQEALSGVNSLIAKGFKADQAQLLVKAMADLKSVVPDANIGNLLLAITQIKSKGVLQMEELQGQIAEAGLSVSVVLEEIGKKIGKSAAEVRKMIGAGKISADQGVQGILAAIQRTTGKPIGDAAKEASNSLAGLIARIQQIPEGLLMSADASKGLGIIKDVLKNILSVFAPSTAGGKALAAAFGELGNAIASVFSGLAGKSGAEKLQSFAEGAAKAISRIASVIEGVGAVIGPMIGGLVGGLGKGMAIGDAFFGTMKDGGMTAAELAPKLEAVGQAIGVIIGFVGSAVISIAKGFTAVQDVSTFLERIPGTIAGFAGSVFQAAWGIGANLVQGIISGMSGGLPGLIGAVAQVALITTGTAQTGFGVHSPSTIWRDDIGYQLPAGAAQGVEKGKPLLTRAASSLATSTNTAGARSAGTLAPATARAGVSIGELHFHGMSRGDADFYEARTRALWAELGAA